MIRQPVSPFLTKYPSHVPRVLDAVACPPHNLCHLIESYPLYYDPVYYPQFHTSVFATSENFCLWLRVSLSTHCNACLTCRSKFPSDVSSLLSVSVLSDGVSLCVCIDNVPMTFDRAWFESPGYSHCKVFSRFLLLMRNSSATTAQCLTSCVHGFIMWMNAMKSTSMGCLHPYYLLRLVPFRQESQLCARNMNTSVQSCQILSHGALRYRSCRTRLSCNIFQLCRSHLIVLPIDAPFKKEAREVKSSHSERLATQNRCRGLARQAPLRFQTVSGKI